LINIGKKRDNINLLNLRASPSLYPILILSVEIIPEKRTFLQE
jgi:hypothetical protein